MTNLHVYRGDSIRFMVGPVVDYTGHVQDLSGAEVQFTAKERLSDPDSDAIITGSVSDGRIILQDALGGMLFINIPPAGTSSAAFAYEKTLYWDLQIASGPDSETIDSGLLYVRPDVSRGE